eukprot:363986-Chlamydomonas_euryale.AAC.9
MPRLDCLCSNPALSLLANWRARALITFHRLFRHRSRAPRRYSRVCLGTHQDSTYTIYNET